MIHGFAYVAHVMGNAMASHESWLNHGWCDAMMHVLKDSILQR